MAVITQAYQLQVKVLKDRHQHLSLMLKDLEDPRCRVVMKTFTNEAFTREIELDRTWYDTDMKYIVRSLMLDAELQLLKLEGTI